MKLIICMLSLALLLPASAEAVFSRGDKAPDFEALTLQDKSVRLSDSKGTPLLIELGATWCPSCNEQAHQIDKIRDFLKQQGIIYVTVFLADPADAVENYLKEEGLNPPDQVLLDSGEARTNYLVLSIPRLILIDSQFNIVFDEMVLNAEQIKSRITEELPL